MQTRSGNCRCAANRAVRALSTRSRAVYRQQGSALLRVTLKSNCFPGVECFGLQVVRRVRRVEQKNKAEADECYSGITLIDDIDIDRISVVVLEQSICTAAG